MFKISSQEEFGLRFLVQLAKSSNCSVDKYATPSGADKYATIGSGEMSLSEIAHKEGVSLPYVRKIFGILRLGGLVKASKGVQGGYSLLKPASEITLKEIFEVLGSDPQEFSCNDFSGQFSVCANFGDCGVRPLLSLLKRKIDDFLNGITLSQLVSEERNVLSTLQSKIDQNSTQLLNAL